MRARFAARCAVGLTLREILVVLVSGVCLLGIFIWVVKNPRRHPHYKPASVDVKILTMALAAYQRELGAYPPDDITGVGGSTEHGMNEALVFYLGRKHVKGYNCYGPYMEFRKAHVTDDDNDGFKEFRDPWGNLFLYAENKSHKTPTGMNPESFDLVSPGPDGELGGTISPATGYVPAATPEGKAREKDNITNWGR